MNSIRVFTSGLLFLFSIYCLIYDPNLPFSLPSWIYIIATIYFTIFPIKDMISSCNSTLYKEDQFSKNYEPDTNLDKIFFEKMKKHIIVKVFTCSYILDHIFISSRFSLFNW